MKSETKNTIIAFALVIVMIATVGTWAYTLDDNSDDGCNAHMMDVPYGGELIGTIVVGTSGLFSENMTVSIPVSIYTGEPTSGTLSWVNVDASSTTQLNISGTAPDISGTYICTVFYVTEIGDCYDYVMIQVI